MLRNAKTVKPDDPESLKWFSDLLEKSKITLEGIGYSGSLNNLDVITQLINKLPFNFRRLWVKEYVAVEAQSGQIADFSHFVSFVVKLSEETNSLYGDGECLVHFPERILRFTLLVLRDRVIVGSLHFRHTM